MKLLARWGIPADAAVALTEHGTNNRTLQVTAGDRRWSLRISQNLTPPQVRAKHRLTGAELAALAGKLRWRTAEGGELGHIVADAGTSPPALERSCPLPWPAGYAGYLHWSR